MTGASTLRAFSEYVGWRTFVDVLDITLVTYAFYRLFGLIKGTRALHMLVGLAIMAVASALSQWLGFYTIGWLLQNFWTIWVVVIIVLFQPEIRRALAQVGRSSFFASWYPVEEVKLLDEVIKAAVSLSEKKIGALVVFERETPLLDYVEKGVHVGGKVTKELLGSIFLPYAPLHDGAVIISNSTLSMASCILPLTMNPLLSKTLGTRHRAAVGLSEETDAIVLVVSEETGGISLAEGGRLQIGLDEDALRERLFKFFDRSKE